MRRCLIFITLSLLSLTPFAWAQSTTGSIYGTLADSTGAILPNTTVTAKETGTGLNYQVKTNSAGEFVFPSLQPGNYTVSSSAPGFKTVNETGIVLSSNQNVQARIVLQIGQVDESVSVQADTTFVDTREAQLADTISRQRIEDLPIAGRDVYDLLTLVPGVTTNNLDSSAIGTRNGTSFSLNGLPTISSTYYLDGTYDTTYFSNGGNIMPNPDALQEFRVLTSNFDAEFGKGPGGVVNAITQSGTANYHGMAYEYIRNNMFNAKNYFQTSVAPLKQDQFGGNFGGRIPFLSKSKAFFFLSYEHLLIHTPAVVGPTAIVTATALERQGNFTQSTASVKAQLTKLSCNGVQYQICPALLDPVAQNLLAFVPVENTGDTGTAQQDAPADSSANQGLGRGDLTLPAGHQLEMLFFTSRGSNATPNIGVNKILSYAGMQNYEDVTNIALVDTWTISSRTLNSLRTFYNQNRYTIADTYNNHFLPNLGSLAGEGGYISATPLFTINGYWAMGTNQNGPSDILQQPFGLVDTANLTRGRHEIKVGGSYVWNKYSETGGLQSNGIFTFTGSSTGNALADFLEGKANSLVQSSITIHRLHSYDPSLFAQDDWRLTKRLTLDLGVRWEVFPPFSGDTTFGTFKPGVQSVIVPQAPVGLLYQGDAGVPFGVYNTSYRDFAPRFGFAYDLYGNGRTSIRGGYGLFYAMQGESVSSNQQQQPYTLTLTTNSIPNLVCPYGGTIPPCPTGTPAGTDPFPFVYNPAAPRFVSGASINAVTATGGHLPYVQEFNLSLEQQLSAGWGMRISYVGNAARHYYVVHDINAPTYATGAATTTAGINARRPYQPEPAIFTFGAINLEDPSVNYAYNGMQTNLRGRVGRSADLEVNYVWSKALGYQPTTAAPAVPVNGADIRTDYGYSPTDIRNNFSASVLFHFPDVKLWGAFGRQALSGWQLNDITILETGTPFTVLSGKDTNLDGVANDRPNQIADPYTHAGTRATKIAGFLTASAFAVPSGPYGSERNNALHGPGNVSSNMSLFKIFPIHDRLTFQFRAEAFNAFNNVNLGNPVTTLTAVNFGQITSASGARVFQFAGKIIF